jgi:hypothetical protein
MDYDTQPFCSVIYSQDKADFVADENLCPVNSTLYEGSTRPMKLCVPLFTPPNLCAVRWRRDVKTVRVSHSLLLGRGFVSAPKNYAMTCVWCGIAARRLSGLSRPLSLHPSAAAEPACEAAAPVR